MKQDTINKAMLVIQQHRRNAMNEYDEKMKPLYSNKEFMELEKQLTKLEIEKARQEAYQDTNCHSEPASQNPPTMVRMTAGCSAEESKTTEETLLSKIAAIKAKHNLQNLQPNFACPLCQDQGYVDGQMCNCLKKEISNVLLRGSGFEKLESFESSEKTAGDLAPVYNLMKRWCNSDFKKTLIYLAGPTGVGKTHLVRCMANALIERGKLVKIATAYQINQDFKTFSKTFNDDILNAYIQTEVLFIDDLGTEPQYRNVTLEYFYLIINERKMKCLPTIITSNLNMEDVRERYDERIFSRIADRETSITIYLDGDDRRIKKDK